MDLTDIPDLQITEAERRQEEAKIQAFVQKCRESVARRVQELKDAGYSDKEIEMVFGS